ncbi:calmodulin-binding transcription activator 5-like [Andrographis paniculata]|uniref:calmodulin-binding transcription activator 5-like n=1 Tax=Andrographis paniculata TaxID=175694 RepID=UPI0021E7E94A|nr:calmodulin-binding transcription activator 5-like [Andrographis paniculata]
MANQFIGTGIHGFLSMADLDVANIMEEAKARWLRPNEIYAILCNYRHFPVRVKPMNLPESGTIVLFDRKVLRNFRKDGHNWKKKKDGKTVKEAHEHLKVGDEERIHVYYAHGEDNPTFVRRCYWLLDKSLEHIVLVHYRETREQLQGSPATPVNSNSNSTAQQLAATWALSEDSASAVQQSYYAQHTTLLGRQDSMTIKNHEQRLHEINTLEWDDLLVHDDTQKLITPHEGRTVDIGLQNPSQMSTYISVKEGLQTQDSFGKWMENMIADSPESVNDQVLDSRVLIGEESTVLAEDQCFTYQMMNSLDPSPLGQIFNITDVSPGWGFTTEETKLLVVGYFSEGYQPPSNSKLYLVCGDSVLRAEVVQPGVFRCLIPPQSPGLVKLYMSFDGRNPISQVVSFKFSAPIPSDNEANWEEFQLQMRLAHLLFSSSKSLSTYSTKLSPTALKEAKAFAQKTSHIMNNWVQLSKFLEDSKVPFPMAKDRLFELTLMNKLQEWLLEKVVSGNKVSERDKQGQGVIHLCAILGYTWAIYPFSCAGLSLDYRDKFGWTALHWAAYYGREKMVAALLSAGAKPNLVTDPTPKYPGGYTAADLASRSGYDGLAAYLAEKALVAQFSDMTLAGNVSGSLQTTTNEDEGDAGNVTEEELVLKDTLAAIRTAADAAARIQAAFREHSLKVRTNTVKSSNPEDEARHIIAAMKIQHAFRNYEVQKRIKAAGRIQYRFRTWKIRKDFLNMRRQAIKIQSHFRGYRMRKQYSKIVWSVGVLEKAILRWRLKRKGIRGLEIKAEENEGGNGDGENDGEEDFFQASRKQAEERVERSVISVQAMFRSKQAQEAYRRMKLEHNKVKLEYEELLHPDEDMG